MGRKHFTHDQIVRILAEAALPHRSVAAVARRYGISEQTIYRWRQKYGSLDGEQVRKLKLLEEENRRLKRLLAEKELEIQLLQEVVSEDFPSGRNG